jgi:hypothetical protein
MKGTFAIFVSLVSVFLFIWPLQAEKVREPAVAGTWYPGDEKRLRQVVDDYLEKAEIPELEGEVVAIIAPHAGYMYSGKCAGYAFKPVAGKKFSRVIVLAPSHRASFHGASIPDYTHYKTPLGNIELDRPVCQALLKEKLISTHPQAHLREHSLEIELPFLQRAIGDFKLVPILVREMTKDDCYALGTALRKYLSEDTLLVVSSDFTHYGPSFRYLPFTTSIKANLKKLDQGAIERIVDRDLEGFVEYKRRTGATICGFWPISVLLATLSAAPGGPDGPEDTRGHLLNYYTSGDLSGSYRNSVSYAAIVFTRGNFGLSAAEREALLCLCRYALECFLQKGKTPSVSEAGIELTPRLKRKSGAFVTLTNSGRLRGCMGYTARDVPLCEVMVTTTKSAAKDPRFRFNPVTCEEFENMHIEISVLSPFRKIREPEEMVIGRDGVLLIKGRRSALFLPQVAPQQGWDRDTMLGHLCLKAGLRPDAWKENCEFYVFTTECFGGPCRPHMADEHLEEKKD